MKRISAAGNFDKQYLFACLAMAGYTATGASVRAILNISAGATTDKLRTGAFTRKEMLKLAEATSMDVYDFLRCFFTDLLRQEAGRKFAVREALFEIMTDHTFDD